MEKESCAEVAPSSVCEPGSWGFLSSVSNIVNEIQIVNAGHSSDSIEWDSQFWLSARSSEGRTFRSDITLAPF